jgi:HK97 family phage prohead protease
MMDGLYLRSIEQNLELTGDGRTVVGLLAPYNEKALVDDGFGPYYEEFLPGCFDRCTKGRASYLRVQLEHNGHWVGRGDNWHDDKAAGLSAEMRLDDTEAGREAAFKIRDRQTPGLSLAFLPSGAYERNLRHKGLPLVRRERIKALHHVALCQEPAYKSAQVAAMRSAPAGPPERIAYWQEWTTRVKRDWVSGG